MEPDHHSFSSPSWISNFPAEARSINFNIFPMDGSDHPHARETMFEKSLTPSDVGKLNRLVIPKQHAEKHFPLAGLGADKGLLLCFEDDSGKLWRFRYSYWNSSQSYVLTKGWSRFVKDKLLVAGDVVSFHRLRRDGSRLFIGWRRRADDAGCGIQPHTPGCDNAIAPNHSYTTNPRPYNHLPDHHYYIPHAASEAQSALPAVSSPKRLRLFGVNMEWQPSSSSEDEPSAAAFDGFNVGPNHGPSYYEHQFYA